jgi:hypothetical protein
MPQPISSDAIQIPIQDPLEVACAIGYAVLVLGFCFSLLRIMWIDFKERRDEIDKEWIVIGQRRIVWELGRMGKERAWAEVKRVCGEERWDVGIQEENVEVKEEAVEEGTEAEEEEPRHKSGEERLDESGEDQSKCSKCSRCLEGDEEEYDADVEEWLGSLPGGDMKVVDRDGENEAERAEDEEVDFDSDTPLNTPPESLSDTRSNTPQDSPSESHRRLTYASWNSSDKSLDDESRFWRHRQRRQFPILTFVEFAEVSRSVGEARMETESQQYQIHAGRAVRSRERRDEGHAAAINGSCCTKSE